MSKPMETMQGKALLEKLKRENMKWAVALFDTDGVIRATICTVDGMAFGMDLEMLEGVLPLLEKCRKVLRHEPV